MHMRGSIAALAAAGLMLSACAPRDSKSDAAAASTPAQATLEEPAPEAPRIPLDFSQTTPDAEVSLKLDKAIERWPQFHRKVYDEEVAALKKFAADAKTDRDGMKGESFQPPPYGSDTGYEPSAATARLVSFRRTWFESTGGAHPNHGSSGVLWDTAARRTIEPAALFIAGNDAAIQKALCDGLKAAKAEKMPGEDLSQDTWGCPEWRKSKFALTPSTEAGKLGGLTFLFDPYEVGSYAEGDYEVTLPWTVFKAVLAPAWAGEFGGAPKLPPRPKD